MRRPSGGYSHQRGWASNPQLLQAQPMCDLTWVGLGRVQTRCLSLGRRQSLRQCMSDRALVVSLDFTREMLIQSWSIVPQGRNEILLQGDWRLTPFVDATFDGVVGDKVVGNVMPQDWPQWFLEIHRILRPGGHFVTRVTLGGLDRLEIPATVPFRTRLREWATRAAASESLVGAASGLWEECMYASTRAQSGLSNVGTQRLDRVVSAEEWTQVSELSETERDLLAVMRDRFFETREAEWSAYSLNGLAAAAERFFLLESSEISEDYTQSSPQPVITFVRRD